MGKRLYAVSVAGATGAVGLEMIKTLEQRQFPVKSLKLLASERSVGRELNFRGEKIRVEKLSHDSFKGIEIALFSAGVGPQLRICSCGCCGRCRSH